MVKSYYLRSDAICEPLVNRWYAWSMLVSPATAALMTLRGQIRILQSYIQMPGMHENAVKNPKMRGGPFIDFAGENRVESVQKLLDDLQQTKLISLAQALEKLHQMLATADGHSLAPFYADIPEILQGYIELMYDLNHHANFRIIESLLYKSPLYNTDYQSLILSRIQGDHRPFALSTPRLDDEKSLHWHIPFASPEIDFLFVLREQPVEKSVLDTFFTKHFSSQTHLTLFDDLFTTEAPLIRSDYKKFAEDGVRLRYFGHACVLIETREVTILVDPIISYGYATDLSRFTYDDLPERLDYVILTHAHQDHVMLEHLLQLRYKIGTIVVPGNTCGLLQDPSLKLLFKQLGFQSVIALDEMESIMLPYGALTGIPFFGEHGDLHIQSKLAWLVTLKGKKIIFAADSENIAPALYKHIHQEIGAVDILFLGMECEGAPMSWLYGPLLLNPPSRSMDQARRLNGSNSEKAMALIRQLACPEVYIYAMGREPWLSYITSIEYTDTSNPMIEARKLLENCTQEGRKAEMLYLKKEWTV